MSSKIYKKGYIYKISSKDGTKNYYGSTSNYKHRMSAHKSDYKRYLDGRYHYVSSFEIIKDSDYLSSIELECSNISKTDLELIEQLYIKTYDCVNKLLKMTDQEKDNNQKESKAKYVKENKIKINKKQREVISCECGMTYTKSNKSHHEKSFYHKNYINTKNRQAMNIATQINITNLTINQAT